MVGIRKNGPKRFAEFRFPPLMRIISHDFAKSYSLAIQRANRDPFTTSTGLFSFVATGAYSPPGRYLSVTRESSYFVRLPIVILAHAGQRVIWKC